MGEKIFNALAAVSVDVLALPSPKQTVEKFSVRAKDEVQFVHLFKSSANCTTYVKCCSGICQTRFNKKVRAIHISDANICDRLKNFKDYIDANSNKHPLLAQLDKEIDDMTKGMENGIKNQLLFISMMKQIMILKFLTENPSKYEQFVFLVLSKNALIHHSTNSLNLELHIL